MRTCFISLLLLFAYLGLFSQYDIVWESHFGGENTENSFDIIETSDGNYLVAGSRSRIDASGLDAYLVLLSGQGEVLWERQYGGSGTDMFTSILEVADGFILAGYSNSDDVDSDNYSL